jgi:hypothetical protein
MTHGHVTFIDTRNYAKVAPYRWHTNGSGYAITSTGPSVEKRPVLLHVFLFPDIPEPRDHVNRNKLDNRAENIIDGGNGANNRNANRSGVTEYENSFMAHWTEFGADRALGKRFSWNKLKGGYPSREAAKFAADRFYAEQSQIALEKTRVYNLEHGPQSPLVRKKPASRRSVTSTGIKGLSDRYEGTSYASILARKTINKIVYSDLFRISDFGSRSSAIERGKLWLIEIAAAHPIQKPVHWKHRPEYMRKEDVEFE